MKEENQDCLFDGNEKDKRRAKRLRDIKDKKGLYSKWKPSDSKKSRKFNEEDFEE